MTEVLPSIHIENPQSPTQASDDAAWSDHPSSIFHQHTHSVDSTTNGALFPRLGDASSQPVDPLSQEIWMRVGGPQQKLNYNSDTPSRPATGAVSDDPSKSSQAAGHVKEKKKGVSFLARLISNKKKDNDNNTETASAPDENRPEGAQAEIFQEPFDYMGFHPDHPPPPTYIKVRSKHKTIKEFNRVFLAQELQKQAPKISPTALPGDRSRRSSFTPNDGRAMWAAEFSKDGRHFATAGQDSTIRIWSVIATTEDRKAHEVEEDVETGGNVSGSRLSAPVFRQNPLRMYDGHTGPVLGLSWSKNGFLLSSSMDKTVRLWHVSQNECLCVFRHNDVVTSLQFHPKDDRFFLAGSLDTRLRLWSIPDKSVVYHISVSDIITAVAFTPDGRTAIAGSVSGICSLFDTDQLKLQTTIHVRSSRGKNSKGSKITGIEAINRPAGGSTDTKLLITSNDSRIRLYNLRDKSLEAKFKGLENASSQIRARFSDDAQHVLCGSEDGKVFIWNTTPAESEGRNKFPVEVFEATSSISSVALFAPTRTRMLLNASADPIYEICNPPPVKLLSKAEEESLYSKPPTEADTHSLAPSDFRLSREPRTPGAMARSQHSDGQILLVGDADGGLKAFRQDCAASKRFMEPSPIKRAGTSIIRRASLATQRSTRSRRSSLKSQAPSERILTWRQSLASAAPSLRSLPRASTSAAASPARDTPPADALSTRRTSQDTTASSRSASAPRRPPLPAASSSLYFRRDAWKDDVLAQLAAAPPASRAPSAASLSLLETRVSRVSALSSAASSLSGAPDDDAVAAGRGAPGMAKCRRCGGLDFKARVRPGIGVGRRGQLACMRCGLLGG